MKKVINWAVTIITAVLGLGIVAAKNAPEKTRPIGEKPIPQTAIVLKDEAMEELEKANKLNKQQKKH